MQYDEAFSGSLGCYLEDFRGWLADNSWHPSERRIEASLAFISVYLTFLDTYPNLYREDSLGAGGLEQALLPDSPAGCTPCQPDPIEAPAVSAWEPYLAPGRWSAGEPWTSDTVGRVRAN